MPAIHVVDKIQAIQYNGSNSSELDALITQFEIVSETGGVLNVESPSGTPYEINTNDWVRFSQGYIFSVHGTTNFNNFFIRNAVYDEVSGVFTDVEDLQDAVAALEAAGSGLLGAGIKESPLLVFNQSTVVPVEIVPAQPNSNYTPNPQLFASATALGNLSITNVAVVDNNTVDVTIQNSGLASLSGVHILVTVTE